MGTTLLAKGQLPAFIYLTDQILDYDFTSEKAEYTSIYTLIADEGVDCGNRSIAPRTIRRAFKLRESLKKGEIVKEGDKRPTLVTLNVLVCFHFDQEEPRRFKAFEKMHGKEIREHYRNNIPSAKVVDLIFPEEPEKLDRLKQNKERLEEIKFSVEDKKFYDLKNELTKANARFEAFEKKVADEQKLQNNLISDLQRRIDQLERKHKKASFVYRFFGAFGLFFVSIDYREANLYHFLDDFMNDYQGMTEDTILDDLL